MQTSSLLEFSKEELKELIVNDFNEKSYRARQLLNWLYKSNKNEIKDFSNLPESFKENLQKKFKIYSLKLIAKEISNQDATVRYDFETSDNYKFSCVYIPKQKRNVVCVSTQIGCSIGCIFCASAKVNFKRNLTSSEIVEQVLRVKKDIGEINGVLFMGMGEPLLNYENLVKSIKILLDPDMFFLSKRRITVSTVGIVANIYKLAQENLKVKLAISLHSPNDAKRKKFIKNLNFSVKEILKAGIFYAEKTETKLTIEYVLLKDENDSVQDALELVHILKSQTKNINIFKINLIPYNPHNTGSFLSPLDEKVKIFKDTLIRSGFLTFIRKPHGQDIKAACGQLGF
ncbi:MAG: 23S rRNA (adenine(2503)-C(2))-methyltransferase RlmN [Endomicrobiia bacterium]